MDKPPREFRSLRDIRNDAWFRRETVYFVADNAWHEPTVWAQAPDDPAVQAVLGRMSLLGAYAEDATAWAALTDHLPRLIGDGE